MTLLVKPVSLMATHWKFMESASGSGVSTRRRAASCAAAKTVCNIVVGRKQQTTSTHSLPGVRLAARPLAPTRMAERSRPVRLVAPISVRKGLALDWPQYSKGRYDGAQRDAEHAGRGIWKGSYVEPWLYRACIRASGKPSDCSDDANAHP